jgi:hypothetical protein
VPGNHSTNRNHSVRKLAFEFQAHSVEFKTASSIIDHHPLNFGVTRISAATGKVFPDAQTAQATPLGRASVFEIDLLNVQSSRADSDART